MTVNEQFNDELNEMNNAESADELDNEIMDSAEETEEAEKEKPWVKIFQKAKQIATSKKLWKTLSYVASIALFLITIFLSVYYIFVASQGEFHADCTDTIMWAAASHESGHMYDENFSYACFLPFGVNLIMQPLISMFGVSMLTHHLGMLGFFILFTVFFVLMLREMHINFRVNLVASSIMLALTFSSPKMREIFWGHTIYYSLGLLFIFIGLFLYFKLLNLADKRTKFAEDDVKGKRTNHIFYIVTLVILCVFIALTATDGISALSIFALPLLAGVVAEQVLNNQSKLLSRNAIYTYGRVILFFVMVFLGTKLAAFWQGDLIAGYQDANSMFSTTDKWLDNALSIPVSWLTLFGVKSLSGVKISDKEGIINLLYIFNAIIIAVMPVIATCFYAKYKNDVKGKMLRIFIWMHWAVTAIVMVGFICGILSAANWRLVPVVGTSIITTIFFVIWVISSKIPATRISVLLCIPVIAVSFLNMKEVAKMPSDNYKDNVLFSLADVLEEQGLDYGYATFWNANSITLISDSKIKVRDVNVNEYGVSSRLYQSSSKWYEDQENQEKYFLLVSAYEYGIVETSAPHLINEAMSKVSISVNNQDFHILVFDHNIV